MSRGFPHHSLGELLKHPSLAAEVEGETYLWFAWPEIEMPIPVWLPR